MAAIPSFAGEGFRELRRRLDRVGLRKQIRTLDDRRSAALATLGQTAWQARVDLTAFGDLRDQVSRLEARAGDLDATARSLAAQRVTAQSGRQAEESRFAALLQPATARQAETDAALRIARAALAEKDRALRELQARVNQLSAGLAKPASPPAPDAAAAATAQHAAACAEIPVATAARDQAAAQVQALAGEAQHAAEDVAKIQADRKAALQPIDTELKRLQEELVGATRETATVAGAQQGAFLNLGTALHRSGVADPALEQARQAVAKLDQERTAAQASLDASLGLTRAVAGGTMAAFWTVFVVVPLLVIVGVYLVAHRGSSATAGRTFAEQLLRYQLARQAGGPAAGIAAEEAKKDEAVQAFLRAPGDRETRERATEILAADLQVLGSTTDRWHLPVLAKIVKGGVPELREAATQAVGMIGPTAADVPLLAGALNDPVPAVREAAVGALEHVRGHDATALLVRYARTSMPPRRASAGRRLEPDAIPDASGLHAPGYPGASYLFYASDVENGRVAFAAPDPFQKVVDFYASRAGRPSLDGEQFSRTYLGASDADPTGGRRLTVELDAWIRQAIETKRPGAEVEVEGARRAAMMQNLPLVRYADTALYRSARFVALEEGSSSGGRTAPRWVAIVDQPVLGRTAFEIHVPPAAR